MSESAANALSEKVAGIYKGLDIEVHFGGQPVYYYLLSVE